MRLVEWFQWSAIRALVECLAWADACADVSQSYIGARYVRSIVEPNWDE